MHKRLVSSGIAWTILLGSSQSSMLTEGPPNSSPVVLTVAAAASMRDALSTVIATYEAGHPGVRIELTTAATGTLQQQIEHGAPVDVFISVSRWHVDKLEAGGFLVEGSRRLICRGELGLAVRRNAGPPGLTSFQSLGTCSGRIAVGHPAYVPAGRYAQQLFGNLGLTEALANRLVMANDVRQALSWLEIGAVETAVVYASDVRHSPSLFLLDRVSTVNGEDIRYEAALVRRNRSSEEGMRFVSFLLSEEAQRTLVQHGFVTEKGAGR